MLPSARAAPLPLPLPLPLPKVMGATSSGCVGRDRRQRHVIGQARSIYLQGGGRALLGVPYRACPTKFSTLASAIALPKTNMQNCAAALLQRPWQRRGVSLGPWRAVLRHGHVREGRR